MHLRVGGPNDIGSVTRNGVSHVRRAAGSCRPCPRCRLSTLAPQGESPASPAVASLACAARRIARANGCRQPRRQANRPRRRPMPPLPAPQGKSPASPAVAALACAARQIARAAGRCHPRRKAKTARAARQITGAAALAAAALGHRARRPRYRPC